MRCRFARLTSPTALAAASAAVGISLTMGITTAAAATSVRDKASDRPAQGAVTVPSTAAPRQTTTHDDVSPPLKHHRFPAPAHRRVPPSQAPRVAKASTTSTPTALDADDLSRSALESLVLSRIAYPWRQLGYSITFHGAKDGYLGLTDTGSHRIDIYVKAKEPVSTVVFVTAYEIAHAVDDRYNTDADRAKWLTLRGAAASVRWWPCDYCNEDHAGSGDFANVFATWATGVSWWTSDIGSYPGARELLKLVPFFSTAG